MRLTLSLWITNVFRALVCVLSHILSSFLSVSFPFKTNQSKRSSLVKLAWAVTTELPAVAFICSSFVAHALPKKNFHSLSPSFRSFFFLHLSFCSSFFLALVFQSGFLLVTFTKRVFAKELLKGKEPTRRIFSKKVTQQGPLFLSLVLQIFSRHKII